MQTHFTVLQSCYHYLWSQTDLLSVPNVCTEMGKKAFCHVPSFALVLPLCFCPVLHISCFILYTYISSRFRHFTSCPCVLFASLIACSTLISFTCPSLVHSPLYLVCVCSPLPVPVRLCTSYQVFQHLQRSIFFLNSRVSVSWLLNFTSSTYFAVRLLPFGFVHLPDWPPVYWTLC